VGEQEEDDMVGRLRRQYYNYISLMRATNNFSKKLALYEGLDIARYQGNIAIVANVSNIEITE
jgi:hypothetical protein